MASRPAPASGWRSAWGLRALADPAFREVLVWTVVVIVLAYRAFQFVGWLSAPQWGYDFSAYWAAAGRLLEGEPLYMDVQLAGPYPPQGQFLYLYPPFLAVVVMPLAAAFPGSYEAAAGVWALIGALLAVLSVLVISHAARLASRPSRYLLLVAAAFAFPPVVGELVLGNVHLLLLALLTVAWWAIAGDPNNRRLEALAGLAVGAAALVKVFPALVLLWFFFLGRWRALAWAIAGALMLTAATIPVAGLEPWLTYPAALLNLGLPADVTDALAPSVWLSAVLPPTVARALVLVAAVALIGWSARRLASGPSFGLAVAVSVLAAPAVFQHYLALLVLPLLLALPAAMQGPPMARLALGGSYFAMWGGEQPLLGGLAWVLNRAIPTLGALGVPADLLRWGPRRSGGRQ